MKLSVLAFSLLMVFVAACAPESPTSADRSTGMAKAVPTSLDFTIGVYSDCCGGELLPIDVTYRQVTRDGGVSYNWKANEWVTGASGDRYHVVFTDNGTIRFDEDSFNGWTGTAHIRVTRQDGCTFSVVVKLRISYDANGNLVKEVMSTEVTCG